MKTCYFCKSPVAAATVDYMAQTQGECVMVHGLKAEQCAQCGELYLDMAASREIDKAIARGIA